MKLIVQIPALNEEATLAQVISDIPRELPGIDKVEVLVIDDGSTDRTVEVAKGSGADHIVSFKNNKGLASAFRVGLEKAISLGADLIVNTDADNQYKGSGIAHLVEPILRGEADVVIGERPIEAISDFSWVKKRSQRIGSYIVRRLSGIQVKDVTSGFRAYSREAALRINIQTDYTYTWESTIQIGKAFLKVAHVDIGVNRVDRPSRLIRNVTQYVKRFFATVIRIYAKFEPLKFFFIIGFYFLLAASVLFVRFWYFFLIGEGSGHVQSLIFGSVLAVIGAQNFMMGILGDLIAANRKLNENILYRLKKSEFEKRKD